MIMETIRIAIIDDHDLFREGIILVLSQIVGFEVVFNTSDGNCFVEALAGTAIDVALVDIEMPALSGALTIQRALEVKPELKVIALTMFSDTGHYTQMIQAGARGVDMGRNIWQSDNAVGMIKAIRAIVHDGLSAKEAAKLLKHK